MVTIIPRSRGMEEVLKARSLSSASARRKRIQERQEEREKTRSEARQRALELVELSDEEDSYSAFDEDMASGPHSREDSVDTVSEYSPMTPEDVSSSMYDRLLSTGPRLKPDSQIVVPGQKREKVAQSSARDPSPGPNLKASLQNFADFNYERYSMFVDTPVDIMQSPTSETDEPETPCEVATPISYRLPQSRPAVISISSNKKRRTTSSASSVATHRSSTLAPDLPERSSRRLSQISAKSGFLASEAAPLSVPELPYNALYNIANASRDSIALSTYNTLPADSAAPRPVQTRKNSMPLLSAAFKSGHARINSIKGLISPTGSSPTSSISHHRPESLLRHQTEPTGGFSRPRTAVASSTPAEALSFETVPADLNQPLPPPRMSNAHHRPSTSYAAARSTSIYSMTALPTPPANDSRPNPLESAQSYESTYGKPVSQQDTRESSNPSPELSMRRKKSFSALRSRSQSISNAIKFVKKGTSGAGPASSARASYAPPLPSEPPLSTTYNHLRDSSRPGLSPRSISTGGFMGYGSSTHRSPAPAQHAARKSIDLFKSFGNSSSHNLTASATSSAKSHHPANLSSTPTYPTPRPQTAAVPSSRTSRLGSPVPQSPRTTTTRKTPSTSSYSVFPSSRGEHGRSVVGLGIRT